MKPDCPGERSSSSPQGDISGEGELSGKGDLFSEGDLSGEGELSGEGDVTGEGDLSSEGDLPLHAPPSCVLSRTGSGQAGNLGRLGVAFLRGIPAILQ